MEILGYIQRSARSNISLEEYANNPTKLLELFPPGNEHPCISFNTVLDRPTLPDQHSLSEHQTGVYTYRLNLIVLKAMTNIGLWDGREYVSPRRHGPYNGLLLAHTPTELLMDSLAVFGSYAYTDLEYYRDVPFKTVWSGDLAKSLINKPVEKKRRKRFGSLG